MKHGIYAQSLKLFFISPKRSSSRFTEYDICEAMGDLIESDEIFGCQLLKNVWRLYTKSEESRVKLLQHGIDIDSQHFELHDTNPLLSLDSRYISGKPKQIKLTIKDIPVSYTNEQIKSWLQKRGLHPVGEVKYSLLHDKQGQLTIIPTVTALFLYNQMI